MTFTDYSATSYSTTSSNIWSSSVTIYTNAGQRYEIPANEVVFNTSTTTSATISWGSSNCPYVTYSTPVTVTYTLPVTTYRQSQDWPGERNPDQEAEFRRQIDDREAQRAKANEEAEALLLACLDDEQRKELAASDSFVVTASSGKRYRIRRGYAGNVEDFDGDHIYSYCGHAYVDGMPAADQMLAQKFALETDEAGYRRIANVNFLRPGTPEEQDRVRRSA